MKLNLDFLDLGVLDLSVLDFSVIDLSVLDLSVIDFSVIDLSVIDLSDTCFLSLRAERANPEVVIVILVFNFCSRKVAFEDAAVMLVDWS